MRVANSIKDAVPPSERSALNLRLGYMTGQYPRVTDTFIQREVSALRELGHHVQTFSIRRPPSAETLTVERSESRRTTTYLLPPRGLVGAHVAQFLSSPRRYISALIVAYKFCPPGIKGFLRQGAYFAEAAMLARLMSRNSLSHLHNHFADSSCSVAAIAAEMGGFTFSVTIHGSGIFYETNLWWIGEKIKRALFVNTISYFCRSQTMMQCDPDLWEKIKSYTVESMLICLNPGDMKGAGANSCLLGGSLILKGYRSCLKQSPGLTAPYLTSRATVRSGSFWKQKRLRLELATGSAFWVINLRKR